MKRLSSKMPLITLLLIVIALLSFLSILIGPVRMSAVDAFSSLFTSNTDTFTILWQVRIPHLLMAMLAGAILASAGCIFMGVEGHWIVDSKFVKTFYIGSALYCIAIIYMMALGTQINEPMLQIAGRLEAVTWMNILYILPFAIFGILVAIYYSKDLNAMVFGEYTAKTLGVSVETVRAMLLLVAAILCGAAFTVCGLAGLIWMILPYFIKLVAGHNYKYLVPSSMLAGAAVFVLFDIFSRIIFPAVIPIGILLSAAGGPLYLFALYRRRLGL
jgi:iron complex transport system permease protein